MKVIIVGGVAGGATAAARLRRLGADACEVKSETGVARFLEECCNRLEGGDAQ
jgi:flavin-dependent dehydrogenase